MTERTVTIKIALQDPSGTADQLLKIRQQRDALLAKSVIGLNVNAGGMEQVNRTVAQVHAAQTGVIRDMSLLGSSISSKVLPPMGQYQSVLGRVLQAGKAIGPGLVSALGNVSAEFQRQRTLAAFWGNSGYLHQGVNAFKGNLAGFLSSAGSGFTGWLKNGIASLAQYKNYVIAAAAAVAGLASVTAIGSMRSQNYVHSVMNTRLMDRKLTDRPGAEAWVEQAQKVDWSTGKQERAGIFQELLSRNPYLGQDQAQKSTEAIEKAFAVDPEMWKESGVGSAKQLTTALSSQNMGEDEARVFESIYGLGFSKLTPQARLMRVAEETKDLNMGEEMAKRPDFVLSNRMSKIQDSFGAAMVPALTTVLGLLIKLTDAWGKFSKSSIGAAMFDSLAKGLGVVANIAGDLASWIGKTFDAVDKAFAKDGLSGVLEVALGGIVANSPMLKIAAFIFDMLRKLYNNSNILNKHINYGVVIWQKMVDFFTWLLDTLKGGLQWLADGLGVTKQKKQEELEKTGASIGKAHGNVDAKGQGIPYKWMTTEAGTGWFPKGTSSTTKGISPNQGLSAGEIDRLNRGKEAVEKAPKSFFEGIPGMALLTDAIRNLITALDKIKPEIKPPEIPDAWKPSEEVKATLLGAKDDAVGALQTATPIPTALWNAASPENKDTITGAVRTAMPGMAIAYDWASSYLAPDTRPQKDAWIADQIKANPALSQADAEASYNYNYPKMARGGQIRATGSLIGHASEEMDPASVVAGGKTTLAKINEMFSGMPGGAGSWQPVTVNTSIIVNVAKMDSKADVKALVAQLGEEFDDKLLFRIRGKLENGSTRGIGYLRG